MNLHSISCCRYMSTNINTWEVETAKKKFLSSLLLCVIYSTTWGKMLRRALVVWWIKSNFKNFNLEEHRVCQCQESWESRRCYLQRKLVRNGMKPTFSISLLHVTALLYCWEKNILSLGARKSVFHVLSRKTVQSCDGCRKKNIYPYSSLKMIESIHKHLEVLLHE